MKIREIIESINGELLSCNEKAELEIAKAFSSDLMSDVLRIDASNVLLITGLSNIQTIRTAEMADVSCVVIARGKKISKEMIELAKENEIVIVWSEFSVFRISGLLFQHGIEPIF